MADDLDDFDDDEWDFEEERLECSVSYLLACILLPFIDGNLTAFAWPGYTLHYAEMGWPAVNAGLSVTVGYAMRVVCQQMQRTAGFWIAIPFAMIHLAIALLAFFFTTSEWAVFLEVVAFICFEPLAVIEGIAFDTFGSSEALARQATSTVLSVFTLSKAMACTLGGVVYDAFGWEGVAMYHVIMQAGLLVTFLIQPSCRNSFMLVFFAGAEEEESEATEEESKALEEGGKAVEKESKAAEEESKAVEEKVDEEGTTFEQILPSQPTQKSPTSSPARSAMRRSDLANPGSSPKRATVHQGEEGMAVVQVESMTELELQSPSRAAPAAAGGALDLPRRASPRASRATRGSMSEKKRRGSMSARRKSQLSAMSRKSDMTLASQNSQISATTQKTAQSRGTMHTMRTIGTALTKMTSLSHAGEGLQHAYSLEPTIITAKGGSGAARNDAKSDWEDAYGEVEEIEGPKSPGEGSAKAQRGIPKDLRLPVALILSSCLCNTLGYVTLYSRFAIFFKEVHDFNATFAGMAQTGGDIIAATVIKVIPLLFSADFDPVEAGWFLRNWHFIISQPYNVSLNLMAWIVLNLCIIAPVLPVAVTAQVLMSSCFVYLQKNNMEMNLFYSLGEQQLFLTMQFMAKNFQAAGGLLAGLGAAALYSIDPRMPFLFAAGMALLTFVLWTSGFCSRVGYGDDIEMAEAKRARRRGMRRVSSWATPRRTTAVTRKTTNNDDND